MHAFGLSQLVLLQHTRKNAPLSVGTDQGALVMTRLQRGHDPDGRARCTALSLAGVERCNEDVDVLVDLGLGERSELGGGSGLEGSWHSGSVLLAGNDRCSPEPVI